MLSQLPRQTEYFQTQGDAARLCGQECGCAIMKPHSVEREPEERLVVGSTARGSGGVDSGLRIGLVLLDCAVTDVVLLSAQLLECYVDFKSICTFCLKVSAILLHMKPSFLTKAPLYKYPMSAAVRNGLLLK